MSRIFKHVCHFAAQCSFCKQQVWILSNSASVQLTHSVCDLLTRCWMSANATVTASCSGSMKSSAFRSVKHGALLLFDVTPFPSQISHSFLVVGLMGFAALQLLPWRTEQWCRITVHTDGRDIFKLSSKMILFSQWCRETLTDTLVC